MGLFPLDSFAYEYPGKEIWVEFEMPDCINFPGSHPLHQGFDPSALVPAADVILVIDSSSERPSTWRPTYQYQPSAAARLSPASGCCAVCSLPH